MKPRLLLLLGLIFLIAPLGGSVVAADSESRIALVIGNAKYPDADSPLKEPVSDMHAMADELKHSGFDVTTGENLGRDAMQKALDALYNRIKPGAAVMVFFSGYGIQSGRQTFMIPVDGQLWTEADVRRDGFSLDGMLNEINSRGAGVKIAILDASRRNPYERRFRSFSAGLAPATAPQGSLVMYSAAPSSVVPDATTDHSLFVNELLKEIRVPGLTADEALNRTRKGVSLASQGDQVPWFSSSLAQEFSFGPGPIDNGQSTTVATAPLPKPPVQTAAPPLPSSNSDEKIASLNPTAPPPLPPPAVTTPAVPALPSQTSAPPSVTQPPPNVTTLPPPPPQVSNPPPAPNPTPAQDSKLVALANDPAIRDLTNLISDNPNDEAAFYKRGQIYASKGAYTLALSDFDQAIRLNPRDVEALNNRCWVRSIVGDLQSALKDCNDALALRPNFVDALDSRGLVNLKLGQNANALNDFDAALKLNPRLASSLYGRGLARQRSGLAPAGDRDIQAAKQISPDIASDYTSYGVR